MDGRAIEAAQLLGVAEANRLAIGVVHSGDEQIIYRRAVDVTRAALGDTHYDAARAKRRSILLNDLIADTLLR